MRVVIATEVASVHHELVRTLAAGDLLILMGDAVLCVDPPSEPAIARSLVDMHLRSLGGSREGLLDDAEILRRIQASQQATVL